MRTAQIEVFADFTCPWCYLTKRRLEVALRYLSTSVRARIIWRPFPQGRTASQAMLEHPGTTTFLTAIGAGEGIAFAFDRISGVPDTTDAHRLVWWATREAGPGALLDGLVERLFRAHLCEGRDIGSPPTLTAVAEVAGLDARRVGEFLASTAGVAAVEAEQRRARDLEIEAIPFILVNARIGIRGARSSQHLAETIQGASWFGHAAGTQRVA